MNNTKELQDSLQEVSVVMRGLKQKIPSNKKFIKTLLHIFCGVSDFRQPAKIKYRLENMPKGACKRQPDTWKIMYKRPHSEYEKPNFRARIGSITGRIFA